MLSFCCCCLCPRKPANTKRGRSEDNPATESHPLLQNRPPEPEQLPQTAPLAEPRERSPSPRREVPEPLLLDQWAPDLEDEFEDEVEDEVEVDLEDTESAADRDESISQSNQEPEEETQQETTTDSPSAHQEDSPPETQPPNTTTTHTPVTMANRALPMLHVVYAGRGDAMYVEFETANNQQQKLYAMDGGPAGAGGTGGGGGLPRPYSRFYRSAARDIWHDKMGHPTTDVIELHAVVNSHLHADHNEGLWKLLRQGQAYVRIEPNNGFIFPAFEEKGGNGHVATLWHKLCEPGNPNNVTPELRLAGDGQVAWQRGNFEGGNIEFPPPHANGDETVLCVRHLAPVANQAGVLTPDMTWADLWSPIYAVKEWVLERRQEYHMNRSEKDSLNFSSLLIHVPIRSPPTVAAGSGIYLTGDNNGNVINYWMNSGVYPPVNVRHFSIYKISHHGSREDSEITPAAGQPGHFTAATMDVVKETCLMMTLIATNKKAREDPNHVNHANQLLLTPEARDQMNDVDGRAGLKRLRTHYDNRVKLQDIGLQAVEAALVVRHLRYRTAVMGLGAPLAIRGFTVSIGGQDRVLPDPWDSWDSLVDSVEDGKHFKKPLDPPTRPVRTTRNNDPDHIPDDWWKKQKMNTNTAQNVAIVNQPRMQANAVRWGDVRDWWAAWWGGKQGGVNKGIWTDLYNDIKKLGRTQAFFRSFTADAYVVSANFHEHWHPNVEVLVGLAWALRHMGRFATLYVTNPASFKKDAFLSMCRFINLDTDVLGTNLIIRYPHKEHTMSLTANPPVTQQYLNERGIDHLDAANVPRDAAGNFVSGIHDFGRTTRVLEEVGQGEDWAVVCKTRDDKLENVLAWDAMLRSTATVFELQSPDTQQFVTLTERHPGTLEFDPDLTAARTQLRVRESFDRAVDDEKMNALFLSRTPTSVERVVIWVKRVGALTDSLYQVMWLDENDHMKAFYLNNGQLDVNDYDNSEDAGAEPASFRFSSIDPQFAQMVAMNFANLTLSDTTVSSAGTIVDLDGLDDDDDDDDGNGGGVGGIASGAQGTVARQAASGNMLYSSMAVSNMAASSSAAAATSTDVAPRSTFDDFFAAARLKKEDMVTTRDILKGMVSGNDLGSLKFASTGVEKAVLDYTVDYDNLKNTWIQYTDDQLAITTDSAKLQLKLPEGAALSLSGGEPAPVVDASVVLEARVDQTLRVGMVVTTQESSEDLDSINRLAVYKVLHNATGPELLARALTAMGWSEVDLAQATMVQTLGAVLGSHETAIEMVYDGIPTRLAMLRGLVDLKPDWHLSPGKAEYTPTGQVYVRNTRIICDLNSVADKALFDAGLTLSGFQVKIKTLTVEVADARMSTEQVTLLADVSFCLPALDAVAVDLQMAISLSSTSDTKEAFFLLSEGSSLDKLLGALGKKDGTAALAGVKLPSFSTTEDADDTPAHAVDSLNLAPGSMGFVLSQYGRLETDVVLDRIFFTAELESWIDVLPLGFKPTTFQDPQISVNITSPFDKDQRRVRVDIDFGLELTSSKDSKKYTVGTRLSAIPLVRKGDYEYRLDLWLGGSRGLSLAEIADIVGLGDITKSIGESVPFIDSALSGVYVTHVSGGLVHEEGKWRFGDWSAGVWLPKFELVPGAVSLVDVEILITNYGEIQIEAHGAVYLPSPLTIIYVDVKTPTVTSQGELWLTVDETRAGTVTLQNILTGLHLGTYDDLPIVGQVLLTELRSLSAVTSPSVAGKPLTLDAFFVKLYHPKITVGGLEFKDVEFMFDVRWVVGEDGKRVGQKQISLSAYMLGDGDLQVSIVYDGVKNTLVAALLPVRPVTIGQMLSACLPAAFPGLSMIKPVVDTLQLKGSSIGFKTKGGLDIMHFDFHVTDESVVEVQRIVLREVMVVYDAEGSPALTDAQDGSGSDGDGDSSAVVKSRLDIMAILAKESAGAVALKTKIIVRSVTTTNDKTLSFGIYPIEANSLTLGGLLSLFNWTDGDVDFVRPEKFPRAFNVVIDVVEGELTRPETTEPETKKSLALKTFHVAAHTQGTIDLVTSPDIDILDVVLDLTYSADAADEATKKTGLSAVLYGKLKIGDILLELAYLRQTIGKDKTEDVFYTQAGLADVLSKPYNKAVKDSKPDDVNMDVLADSSAFGKELLNLPPDLKLFKTMVKPNTLGARIRLQPTTKIEVWASGDELWHGDVCGVDVDLQKIGALFKYTEGAFQAGQQTRFDSVYEAYLRGHFAFKGYSADAELSIGPKGNARVTALLRKDSSGVGDIAVFEQVTDDVAAAEGTWKKSVPGFQESLSFTEESQLFFSADFKTRQILFTAVIQDYGGALLLGKEIVTDATADPPKKERKYIFFLEATDLGRLWSETKEEAADQFNISRLSVQVIGYNTTLKELRGDVSDVIKSEEELDEPDDDRLDPLKAAPARTALKLFEGVDENTEMKQGTWFVADIDIGQSDKRGMTSVIALDASNAVTDVDKAPTIRLYAHVVPAALQADDHQTTYGINIRNLQIFDGVVTINGAGAYFPAKKELRLNADLKLLLSDKEPKQELNFQVELAMTKTVTSYAVAAGTTSSESVQNPFGGMFNVRLEKLGIHGSSTRATAGGAVQRECTIYGSVLLGSDISRARILGLIHFEQGKPVVGVVEFTRKVLDALPTGDELVATEKQSGNVKMTEIYGDLIKPSPAADEQPGSWPEDWDDFEIEEAYMSYNQAEASVAVGDRQYPPGFYLYGLFRVFELPISVSMQIMPRRKGLALRGSYADELDLGLIKLTSYPKKNIDGLTLSLDTTDGTKYGVESGIQLLEFNKIYFKLDYKSAASKADRKLEGTAEYDGTILSYPNPTINFWYADGLWGFTGWKIRRTAYWESGKMDAAPPGIGDQLDNVALNIDKAIRKASESDGKCGPLVDFAINELVTMQFEFTLGMPAMRQKDMVERKENAEHPGTKGFRFTVDWLYSIKIKGTDIGTNIELTQFDFVLPYDGFEPTSTGILKYLWEKVLSEENLEEIGRKMLDPKTLGKLVGVLAIDVLAPEIIKKLICREPEGDDTKKLRDRGKKDHEQETNKKKDDAKKNGDDMDDVKDNADGKNDGGGGGGGGGGGFPSIPIPPVPVPPFPPPITIPVPPLPPLPIPPIPIPPIPIPGMPLPDPPKPLPFPVPENPPPDTTPPDGLPDDEWPKPDEDHPLGPPYYTAGLLVLIKMYVQAATEINGIKPDDLDSGLGAVLKKWKQWEGLDADIATRYNDVLSIIAEAVAKGKSAKKAIEGRMNLQKDYDLSAKFMAPDEAAISVDVTNALPLPKWVHPEDYQGVQWQVYMSTEDKAPTPDTDLSGGYLFPGPARILECPSEAFRYVETAYIWVRMRCVYKGFEFLSTDWKPTTALHKPWLKPPTGVQLFADADARVVVELPPVQEPASDWDLSFVTKDGKDVLYDAPAAVSIPHDGPGKFVIDVMDLGLDRAFSKPIVARVKQRPWSTDLHHESLTADSVQELPVLTAPTSLVASMHHKDIVLVWDAGVGLTATDYAVKLLRKETGRPANNRVTSDMTLKEGKITTMMALTELEEGQQIEALVSAKSAGALCLWSRTAITVDFPLEVYIDSGSSFDLASGIVSLSVRASMPLTQSSTFQLRKTRLGADGSSATEPIAPRSVNMDHAVLRFELAPADYGSTLRVLVNAAGAGSDDPRTQAESDDYDLPDYALVADVRAWSLGDVKAEITAVEGVGAALEVTWTGSHPQVQVQATMLCETVPFQAVAGTEKSEAGRCEIEIEPAQLPPSGTEMVVYLRGRIPSSGRSLEVAAHCQKIEHVKVP